MWLLPLVSGLHLVTRARVEPVEVLHLDATVRTVDFEKLATHPDFLASTQAEIEAFVKGKVCAAPAAAAPEAAPAANATANASFLLLRVRNATNGTNGTEAAANGTEAPAPECPVVVRLFGNPFHIHVEAPFSEATEAVFASPELPKEMSDFLLTLPPVLLFAPAPPIVETVSVEKKAIASVIPDCEAHLPGLLKSLSAAYTERMLPWALDGACGSFMTTLSFSPGQTATDEDRIFCETASKKLMKEHFVGDREYEDWCVEVCERRNGPTAVCARPSEAPASLVARLRR